MEDRAIFFSSNSTLSGTGCTAACLVDKILFLIMNVGTCRRCQMQ
jgi:hypothetical protein